MTLSINDVKQCPICKEWKVLDDFYRSSKGCARGRQTYCKACENARGVAAYRALRAEAIQAYGGFCSCCGETDPKVLAFDHVNGDGAAEAKKYRKGNTGADGTTLRRWKREGWPDRIQLLCSNCNTSKGTRSQCHHQEVDLWEMVQITPWSPTP